MVVGSIGAMVGGACMPMFSILFGNVVNSLSVADQSEINKYCLYFIGLGVLALVMNTLQVACWDAAAEVRGGRVLSLFSFFVSAISATCNSCLAPC